MPLLKNKGGSLQVWDEKGKRTITIHYGPGLHKDCTECKVKKHELCITASGRLLGKVHRCRLS